MSASPQILISHPSPLLAAGIASALNWDCEVQTVPVGTAAHVLAAQSRRPDVLIADHDTAVNWLSQARQTSPSCGPVPRCLVVGAELRGWQVRRALEQGAHGYIDAQCELQEMACAVRSIRQGQRYLCAAASACIADSLTQEPLTPRELQVLGLICEGLGNKSIAARLEIALGTVKAHVRTVLDKLGAASRTQAAAKARRQGLVQESPRA